MKSPNIAVLFISLTSLLMIMQQCIGDMEEKLHTFQALVLDEGDWLASCSSYLTLGKNP
jgi:hypothetical protein